MSALSKSPITLSLETAIDPNPLTVTPQTLVLEAIALMHQGSDRCTLLESPQLASESEEMELDAAIALSSISCLLVVERKKLVGLLTERDLVRLAAIGMNLSGVTIAEVMTRQLITAKKFQLYDIFSVLNLLGAALLKRRYTHKRARGWTIPY